ncbi:MAG TPA: ATP-binding protein [Phycisphaerae bacterium]|nr:ATP-binding protein [Phycisphaerae bacterium]
MQVFGHLGLRQKFLWMYTGIVCTAAATALIIWPSSWCAIVATLTITIAAAWLVARWMTWALRRRVHELREATEAVSRGDLDQHLNVLGADDFVKLAESLEHMVQQLRETLREREHLQKRLTRSEKLALIGELAAGVAHEINNPLDGLQNSTRIIRRNLADVEKGDQPIIEQTRRLLDLMESGLFRIEMIVRRLLTMSRDEPVNLAPIRLDEIVQDAVEFVRPRFQRHGVEFLADFPGQPVFAKADRVQLVQVLINLMINAADAMPDGGRLVVRCRSADDGRLAILEMSDTGHGIAPEHLPHVFEPFYTTKGKGTGLGLSVVARIIEAHGGSIDVTSEPGCGTLFRIELPGAGQIVSTEHPKARDRSFSGDRPLVPIVPLE